MTTPILGLHHVTAITNDARENIAFYTQTLGLRLVKLSINYDDPASHHLYYGDGVGSPGRVHHVALRVPDDAAQLEWLKRLWDGGFNVSPVMDRDYFYSIYFREPGGVLFELATDGPGMAFNEPVERLGTRLMLPPWLEKDRAALEAGLPRLDVSSGNG
jgi:glyoxalase family protein